MESFETLLKIKRIRKLAENYPLDSVEDRIILANFERIVHADMSEWLYKMNEWADFREGKK